MCGEKNPEKILSCRWELRKFQMGISSNNSRPSINRHPPPHPSRHLLFLLSPPGQV